MVRQYNKIAPLCQRNSQPLCPVFSRSLNFFVDSFIEAFASVGVTMHARTLSIILPVGISFYTFQTLSYTIDVYRKKLKPTKDVIAFFTFVAFFPQLVSGPIERAVNLLPQFYKKRTFNVARASDGMKQILWGLFKKVIINFFEAGIDDYEMQG